MKKKDIDFGYRPISIIEKEGNNIFLEELEPVINKKNIKKIIKK